MRSVIAGLFVIGIFGCMPQIQTADGLWVDASNGGSPYPLKEGLYEVTETFYFDIPLSGSVLPGIEALPVSPVSQRTETIHIGSAIISGSEIGTWIRMNNENYALNIHPDGRIGNESAYNRQLLINQFSGCPDCRCPSEGFYFSYGKFINPEHFTYFYRWSQCDVDGPYEIRVFTGTFISED